MKTFKENYRASLILGVTLLVALSFRLRGALFSASPSAGDSAPASPTPLNEESVPDLLATDNYAATLLAESIMAGATLERSLTDEPLPRPTPRLGIIEEPNIMNFPRGTNIRNVWQNYINDEFAQIGFGSLIDDLTQGAVYVWIAGRLETHITPLKDGPIKVIAAQDNRLTLLGEGGVVFYFDIPGRQFVPSLTEVVTTITPVTPAPTAMPTLTRTPGPTATLVPTCVPGPTPLPGTPFCNYIYP